MSNIQLIIEERAVDIGNFLVGRLLPFKEKRAVCTAPKKLDTIWGYFYGKKSQV